MEIQQDAELCSNKLMNHEFMISSSGDSIASLVAEIW
jgi:hypothetical protein